MFGIFPGVAKKQGIDKHNNSVCLMAKNKRIIHKQKTGLWSRCLFKIQTATPPFPVISNYVMQHFYQKESFLKAAFQGENKQYYIWPAAAFGE